MQKDRQPHGDPSCKLCGSDATHFISLCTMLEAKCRELLPPQLWDMDLPDPVCEPNSFACIVLGIDSIDDIEAELKAFRAEFIQP